jgi:hypothetical protein
MLGFGSAGAATAATGISATGLGLMAGTTALGIASPVVGAVGQRQQAKAQMQFQEQQRQAAIKKQGLQRTSALLEQSQKVEAIKQQKGELFKMYRAAEATETARGAMAQTTAISNELKRQLGGELSRLERQEELYGMQYGLGMQQLGLAGQQELLGLSQPIQTESPLVTSLKALSGGLSGAGAGLDFASATRRRRDVGIGNKKTVENYG